MPYMSNTKFFTSLDKAKDEIDDYLSKRVRALIFDIYAGLIHYPQNDDGTPRDTARAVAGWFVSVDTPSSRVPPEDSPSFTLDESSPQLGITQFLR